MEIKKFFKNPYIIGLLASLSAGLILSLISVFFIPKQFFTDCIDFILSCHTFAVWQIALLMLIIPFLIVIVIIVRKLRHSDGYPRYLNYTSDKIDGILCQWDYEQDFDLHFDAIKLLCPNQRCKNELSGREYYDKEKRLQSKLWCSKCDFEIIKPTDILKLKGNAAKEIRRRIRNKGFNI